MMTSPLTTRSNTSTSEIGDTKHAKLLTGRRYEAARGDEEVGRSTRTTNARTPPTRAHAARYPSNAHESKPHTPSGEFRSRFSRQWGKEGANKRRAMLSMGNISSKYLGDATIFIMCAPLALEKLASEIRPSRCANLLIACRTVPGMYY